MATRKPLVRIGGKNQQLPAADSIDVPGARFHEGATEPTIKDYGDRWLDTSSGIKYTWVDPGVWVDLSEPTSADIAEAIHAATSKTTPVDADELGIADSAATFGLKKLTWANLKATLGGVFVGKTGAHTMAGALSVPAGATGDQVPQAQEVFLRDGSLLTLTAISHDITGIPAGAKEVFLHLEVTVPASLELKLRLGTSGGFVTTGYTGLSFAVTSASLIGMADVTTHTSIRATTGSGVSTVSGMVRITRTKFDTTYGWVIDGIIKGKEGSNLRVALVQSQVILTDHLTQLRVYNDDGAMGGTIRYFWRK